MKPRMNFYKASPDAIHALMGLEGFVNLTVAVAAINAWNRLAIGFRAVHPAAPAQAA